MLSVRRLLSIILPITAFFFTEASFGDKYTPAENNNLNLWGFFQDFSDKYWIESAGSPSRYYYYAWEEFGYVLTINGLDNDGHIIAGRMALDPESNSFLGVIVRNGRISKFSIEASQSEAILTGTEAGAEIRQVLKRQSDGFYTQQHEEKRRGKWVVTQSADFVLATSEMISALGWIEKNLNFEQEAAATREALLSAGPSFLHRLGTAFQQGAIVGVQDGVRDRVYKEIYDPDTNLQRTTESNEDY